MSTTWQALNPLQPGLPAAEKVIRATTLLLALASLWQVAASVSLLAAAGSQLDGNLIWYVLGFGLLPAMAVAFGRRWPIGWMLLLPYLAYVVTSGLLTSWVALLWLPVGRPGAWPGGLYLVGVLGQELVAAYLLYRLSRADVRAAFRLREGQQHITLLLAALLSLGQLGLLLLGLGRGL